MRFPYILLVCAASLSAQQPSTSGWTALGAGAAIRANSDGLAFSYELHPNKLTAAFLPAPASFARMERMRFRAKSDYDTTLGVVLSEKMPGGGRYVAWFWSPANTWQNIELTAADFIASDGPNDPVDADGKLDVGEVQTIALLDLSQFFASLPENQDFPVVINRPEGPHTILFDRFETVAGSAGSGARSAGRIDSFDRGFSQWVTLGGIDLKLNSADNPLKTPALRAAYPLGEGRFTALVRRVSNIDLSKATHLAFDIASEHETTLVLSLETKSGGRYNQTIYPPGGREPFHVNLKLSDFEGSGHLDPGQVKSLFVVDISAATGGTAESNTIWVANVAAN